MRNGTIQGALAAHLWARSWARVSRGAGAALVIAATAAACGSGAEAPPGTIGTLAPPFAAATLEDDTVELGELRGEAVLVNIWATWCAPCRREMPGLAELHERFRGDGFQVVAVSVDARGGVRSIREFVEEYRIPFTVLHDPEQQVTRAFRTFGVPESILLDRDGRVIERWFGEIDALEESVIASVREALGSGSESG